MQKFNFKIVTFRKSPFACRKNIKTTKTFKFYIFLPDVPNSDGRILLIQTDLF